MTAHDPPPDPAETSGPREPDEEPPRLAELLERSPSRLLVEAALGAAAGTVLSSVLPAGEGREPLFAIVGAVGATLALMLTPLEGSAAYRGVRYGLALAAVLTLFLSFAVGADALRVDELLGFGLVLFGIGALGHGILAVTLDRGASRSDGDEMDNDS